MDGSIKKDIDEKILSVPQTEAVEDVSIPIIEKQPTPMPVPKKKNNKKTPKINSS